MANTQSREHGSSGSKARHNGSGSSSESSRGGEPGESLRETASTVIDAVEKVAKDFTRGTGEATKLAQEYRGKAMTYAKSHPWQSIAAAGVLGILFGLLLKRRRVESDM